ncbi:MAG: hypothetical protein M0Q91_14495 [Methanoregula sp.]|jgi:hypothetical protein|nr:hypothetical protein [Methanoregula sp.]
MSDGLTDVARAEKEKAEYFDAVYALSKYIADRAKNRPDGVVREKYLEMAYKETFKNIKESVEEMIRK